MRRSVLMLGLMAATSGTAVAQTPYGECNTVLITASLQTTNICNAAVDGLRIFHPVAGLLISSGNPALGTVNTLGGFPRFSLGLRVTATQVVTPSLSYDGTTTTVPKDNEIPAPFPMIDGALGVLSGFGTHRMGSLDLIGSAEFLPADGFSNVTVDKDATTVGGAAIGFGYGLRVGVIHGGGIVPALTASAVWRSLPRIAVGDVTKGDEYAFDFNIKTTSLRAMAGWSLGPLGLGLGYGWDNYRGDATVDVVDQVGGVLTETVKVKLDQSRTLLFADAGLTFGFFGLVGEAGWQKGSSDSYKTTFQGNDPADSRLFGSAGLRFTF